MTGGRVDCAPIVRLEDAGLNASATVHQHMLDGWLLRLAPGKAKRSRCVNAIGAGRLPIADKLAQCEQIYAGAGLPMIVRVTPLSEPAGLDAALDAAGLPRFDDTRVMHLSRLDTAAAPAPLPLRAVNGDEFAAVVGALRATPAAQREAHAERLRLCPVVHRGFVVEREGRVVACGQFAVEGQLVGLYDVFTAADARRQGLARALCRQLLHRAQALGARAAYLQVDADNIAARSVYAGLGFVDVYAYHYRARASAGE